MEFRSEKDTSYFMSNPNLMKFKEKNKNNHVMKAIKEVAAIRQIETFYTN